MTARSYFVAKGIENQKDYSMVSIGARIPKYLSDYINSLVNADLSLNKTDIVTKMIELNFNRPWMFEKYLNGTIPHSDKIEDLDTRIEQLESKIKDLELKTNQYFEIIVNQTQQMSLFQDIVQKLLGVSFEQIKQMPSEVLEQLYAGYIEKNTK